MKGIVYEGPDTLTYRDVPDVTPRRGEVKIRVRACGICEMCIRDSIYPAANRATSVPCFSILGTPISNRAPSFVTLGSVSYTHLDVYKRQVKNMSICILKYFCFFIFGQA